MKHKLHAGWTYRLTVGKKGYKTVVKHVKIAKVTLVTGLESKNDEKNTITEPSTENEVPSQSTTENTNAINGASDDSQLEINRANKYFEKVKDLIKVQKALVRAEDKISSQINAYYRELHSVDYYTELKDKIRQMEERRDKLVAESSDPLSIEYMSVMFELENFQGRVDTSVKEDEEHNQAIKELDSDKIDELRHQSDLLSEKASWNFNEAIYFWQRANEIFKKYDIDHSQEIEELF